MLQHFDLSVLQYATKIFKHIISVVGMNKTKGKERTTFRVRAGHDSVLWKIWLKEAQSLGKVALMDDAKCRCSAELGPIGCTGEPLQVLSKEIVAGGSGIHKGVGECHCRVID